MAKTSLKEQVSNTKKTEIARIIVRIYGIAPCYIRMGMGGENNGTIFTANRRPRWKDRLIEGIKKKYLLKPT